MNVFRTAHIHLMLVATLALQPLTAAAQTTPTFSVTVTESTELVEEVGTTRRSAARKSSRATRARWTKRSGCSLAFMFALAAMAHRVSISAGSGRVTCCC